MQNHTESSRYTFKTSCKSHDPHKTTFVRVEEKREKARCEEIGKMIDSHFEERGFRGGSSTAS